jgi:Putative Ig domain
MPGPRGVNTRIESRRTVPDRHARRQGSLAAYLLTVSAFVLLAPAAAEASMVSDVTTSNSSPTMAAGAQTDFHVSFTTSSTGGMSPAAGSEFTLTYPAGVNLATNFYAPAYDTSQPGSPQVSNCTTYGSSRTTVCPVQGVIAAGDTILVDLQGMGNPSTPGSYPGPSITTTSDLTPVSGSSFTVVAGQHVSGVTIENTSPTTAAGAQTDFHVSFTTSSTGGMAPAAGSEFTLTFPAGADLTTNYAAPAYDTTTPGSPQIANCTTYPSSRTTVCPVQGTIAAGDTILVDMQGVTNPSTPGTYPGPSVTTTSDLPAVSGGSYSATAAPAFTADAPPATALVGTAYSYQFAAGGYPAPMFTVASGTLPPGIVLNSTTGLLSGTPTTGGSSTFTVQAANDAGPDAVSGSITITVTPLPTCKVTALIQGPPAQQQVTVRDAGLGLQAITNIKIVNGTVAPLSFSVGTTGPVVVTATKTNQTERTVWSFDATDTAGNVVHCA